MSVTRAAGGIVFSSREFPLSGFLYRARAAFHWVGRDPAQFIALLRQYFIEASLDTEGTAMSDQGLIFKFLSRNNPQVNAQFNFLDQGSDIGAFMFKCFGQDPITSSQSFLGAQNCEVVQGPGSINEIPARADQALLMTVEAAPATTAVQTKRLRLTLEGVLSWEWDVTFDFPVLPFRMDGTWTRVR
jgi:hypothetical protein